MQGVNVENTTGIQSVKQNYRDNRETVGKLWWAQRVKYGLLTIYLSFITSTQQFTHTLYHVFQVDLEKMTSNGCGGRF